MKQKRGTVKSSAIISNFIYALVFLFFGYVMSNGGDTKTLNSLVSIGIVFAGIVAFVMDLVDQDKSTKDGLIAMILDIIIAAIAYQYPNTVGGILVAIALGYFSFGKFFYTLGRISGNLKIGLWRFVFACIGILSGLAGLIVSGVYILFSKIGDGKFSFLPQAMQISKILLFAGAIITVLGTIYILTQYRMVKKLPSSNNTQSTRTTTNYEPRDSRKTDRSSFGSLLEDRCKAIARSNSLTHSLYSSCGVNFDISARVSSGNIKYIINGRLNNTNYLTDDSSVESAKRNLQFEIEKVASRLQNETSSAIDRLRENYSNYDGEYNINVEVGDIK